MDPAEMAALEAQQKRAQAEMAAELQKMGLDPNEFGMGGGGGSTYADPELAALDREMQRREAGAGGYTEADLLAELDEMEGGPRVDPSIKAQELQTQIQQKKVAALQAKKAGDIPSAKAHFAEMKSVQAEYDQLIAKHPQLVQGQQAPAQVQAVPQKVVQAGPLPQGRVKQSAELEQHISSGLDSNDPIELEDKYHNIDSFVSMEVIEHETKYLDLLIMKYKDSPDEAEFFTFRKESLQFQKETIETNCQSGLTTPESYLADTKNFLATTKKLMMEAAQAHGANGEHAQRLKKRVQLLTKEIQEMEGDVQEAASAAQSEAQPASQSQAPQVQPEEEKLPELNEKQLKVLGILQARGKEYMDAIQYTQKTLKSKGATLKLLTIAERLKELEKKVSEGGALTKEEIARVKAISGEMLFGMDEAARKLKIKEVYEELVRQAQEAHTKLQRFEMAKKKMTRQADKQQTEQVIANVRAEKAELEAKQREVVELVKNTLQPPPELVEVETMINQEKINEEVAADEVQITLTGSPALAALSASYVKFYMTYEQGRQALSDHFQIKDSEKTYTMKMVTDNLPQMLHNLKTGKIDFTLKKKKFLGVNDLETQSLPLTSLGAHSQLNKYVTLQGAKLSVSILIHKATRGKELEKVPGTKLTVGPILRPFKTLEEVAAAKAQPTPVAQQPGGAARQQQPQPQQVRAPQQQQQPQQRPAQARPQQAQPAAAAQQQPATTGEAPAIPAGCSALDIKDPDQIANLRCMSYLEKKVGQFESNMQKMLQAGKIDAMKAWQQKWVAAANQKKALETAVMNQQLSEADYKAMLEEQLVKDTALLAYFKQTGANPKVAIVTERMSDIREELSGM